MVVENNVIVGGNRGIGITDEDSGGSDRVVTPERARLIGKVRPAPPREISANPHRPIVGPPAGARWPSNTGPAYSTLPDHVESATANAAATPASDRLDALTMGPKLVIRGNEIAGAYVGIEAEDVGGLLIQNNDVHDSVGYGLDFYNVTDTEVELNTIANSATADVTMGRCGGCPMSVVIHDNTIVKSSAGVTAIDDVGAPLVLWHDADTSRGNSWSDYTGLDTNNDGVGEIPYAVFGSAHAQDPFPLTLTVGGGDQTATVTPVRGPAGVSVTVSGAVWPADSQVVVQWDAGAVTLGTFATGVAGTFSGSVTTPADATPGNHTITVRHFATGRIKQLTFVATLASLETDPDEGASGDTINVFANGLTPNATVVLRFDSSTQDLVVSPATLTTDENGAFVATFLAPVQYPTGTPFTLGSHVLKALHGSLTTETPFSLLATQKIALNLGSGPAGSVVTVSGRNWNPGDVRLAWDDSPPTT
ncbi:MAG: right-handed parallel beta-helix repeat-containing protein, partial [Chloroflexi bacterium]|nr:right-handed parallel beta-helix repeat-containing protein [Chloroflexota bacterium]